MKLKVVSDLHLEFSDIEITNNGCDTLILSGDILLSEYLHDYPANQDDTIIQSKRHIQAIRFRNFLKNCSDDFANVIYVAGNHEFYNGKFYRGLDTLREECANFPNVHFLENKSVEIDNILFVGGTLWTDCNDRDPLTMHQLEDMMNDFHIIKNDQNNFRRLTTTDIVTRHHTTLEFIRSVVKNSPADKKVVVVGHHSPSSQSVHERYKDNFVMNGGYRSNLDDFILDNSNIVLWTHGHTHYTFDYMIGTTRVVCNPRGYHSEGYSENTGWDPELIIDI